MLAERVDRAWCRIWQASQFTKVFATDVDDTLLLLPAQRDHYVRHTIKSNRLTEFESLEQLWTFEMNENDLND